MASEASTPAQRTGGLGTGTILSVFTLALQALSARLIVVAAMGMAFALFAWAMVQGGSLIRLAIAASFAILVFLPVLWRSNHAASNP